MVKFLPIMFLGYVQPDPNSSYKYGHITQRVEYASTIPTLREKVYNYRGSERSLMFLLPANNNTFHLLLEKQPQARIIRTISNEPILTTNEQLLVDHGLELLSYYAEKQLLVDENQKLILDEYGLAIYTKDRLFMSTVLEDQDLRIPPCAADLIDDELAEATSETAFFDYSGDAG
jgi:hypothetical protein